jgi:putative oxidoreductase
MSRGESIAPFLGRLMLGWFFLFEAYHYGSDWSNTVILLSMKDLPGVPLLLAVSLIIIALGAVSVLLGFHVRAGAATLFVITIAASVIVYDYWHLTAAAARAEAFDIFSRNVAIAGGLLLLVGLGPGRFALDNMNAFARHSKGTVV